MTKGLPKIFARSLFHCFCYIINQHCFKKSSFYDTGWKWQAYIQLGMAPWSQVHSAKIVRKHLIPLPGSSQPWRCLCYYYIWVAEWHTRSLQGRSGTVLRPSRTAHIRSGCSWGLWRAMAFSTELLQVFMSTLRLSDEWHTRNLRFCWRTTESEWMPFCISFARKSL